MEQVLFSEIDTINPTKTQIIIATNMIEMLDPALISRVSLVLDFDKPTVPVIKSIIQEYLTGIDHDDRVALSIDLISEKLLGRDGREITSVLGSAICNSLLDNSNYLRLEDLLTSLEDRKIISHGDANFIRERAHIRINSNELFPSNTSQVIKDDTSFLQGKIDALRVHQNWNAKKTQRATFVSGKYGLILFELLKNDGFKGKIIELKKIIEKSANIQLSLSCYKKIIRGYKDSGLINYGKSPLEIKDPLRNIIEYLHHLSNDEVDSLRLLEKELILKSGKQPCKNQKGLFNSVPKVLVQGTGEKNKKSSKFAKKKFTGNPPKIANNPKKGLPKFSVQSLPIQNLLSESEASNEMINAQRFVNELRGLNNPS